MYVGESKRMLNNFWNVRYFPSLKNITHYPETSPWNYFERICMHARADYYISKTIIISSNTIVIRYLGILNLLSTQNMLYFGEEVNILQSIARKHP
jgi:hypothetical protein